METRQISNVSLVVAGVFKETTDRKEDEVERRQGVLFSSVKQVRVRARRQVKSGCSRTRLLPRPIGGVIREKQGGRGVRGQARQPVERVVTEEGMGGEESAHTPDDQDVILTSSAEMGSRLLCAMRCESRARVGSANRGWFGFLAPFEGCGPIERRVNQYFNRPWCR